MPRKKGRDRLAAINPGYSIVIDRTVQSAASLPSQYTLYWKVEPRDCTSAVGGPARDPTLAANGPCQAPLEKKAYHRPESVPFQYTSCSPVPKNGADAAGAEPSGPMPMESGPV